MLWDPVGVSVGFGEGKDCGALLMKGNEVFKYAVKALDRVVDETLEANHLDKHELDWLILTKQTYALSKPPQGV